MVVTGHTPNFAPGVSVMTKFARADAVILMDIMQYERHGFCNRNKFSDGSWFTIPVAEADVRKPFNEVRIADPTGRAREKVARTMEHRGLSTFAAEMRRPFALLCGLTTSILWQMLYRHGPMPEVHFQSHLATGRYADVSEGLAAMTAEVGGTVWLSGASGHNYLDETPFRERGIEVRYHVHEGPNPTALELLAA